jgi:hypothetical protein
MKPAVNILKIAVGLLFIVSGLVKANDPLGLSYKMEEFFEVWTTDLRAGSFFLKDALIGFFHFLRTTSLALSVSMIALEIMAGIALLVGWKRSFTLWLLFALILFFTFLTGYAYASGKFKNCGCFGDCLPITPLASFLKDIFLLAAILFLLFFKRYIQPARRSIQALALLGGLLVSIGLQWYVLRFLPLADCLPYKKNSNITQQMQIPPTARPDSFAIRFIYEKGGKQFEFAPEQLPADLDSYTFVSRTDKLIRKGNAEPAIKGFTLSGITQTDSTAIVLQQPKAVLYFFESISGIGEGDRKNFIRFYNKVKGQQGIPVHIITTSVGKTRNAFAGTGVDPSFFNIDFTAFRTAARANPTIYYIRQGTIVDKWSGRQVDNAIQTITKQ